MNQPELPDAYPLQWPAGWERTPYHRRRNSSYRVNESVARNELYHAIKLLGGRAALVSSNVQLRLDGTPRVNQPIPDDPGVAVYWIRNQRQEVMACDKWRRPWENMRAIYYGIEGLRSMERAGASQIMERAFRAFQLPASTGPNWRVVLGFTEASFVSVEAVKQVAKEMSARVHPDRPDGNEEYFKRIQQALRDALTELEG